MTMLDGGTPLHLKPCLLCEGIGWTDPDGGGPKCDGKRIKCLACAGKRYALTQSATDDPFPYSAPAPPERSWVRRLFHLPPRQPVRPPTSTNMPSISVNHRTSEVRITVPGHLGNAVVLLYDDPEALDYLIAQLQLASGELKRLQRKPNRG